MITIFRKIRQDYLSKGKIIRYLFYAIGEITLVVIGILIAIQVNNSNENRKNEKYEVQYLIGIRKNIQQDIIELETHFKNDTLKFDGYTNVNKVLNTKNYKFKKLDSFAYYWGNTLGLHWFEGQNIVFEDMKSSGKIHLIQSDSLKTNIQVYYRLFAEVVKQEELFIRYILNYEENLLLKFPMGKFYEMAFPARWNSNVDYPTPTDFFNHFEEMKKTSRENIITENITNRKMLLRTNSEVREKLYRKSKNVHSHIENYLKGIN